MLTAAGQLEKFKGLMIQIEREANVIAKETRRGKGNFILCSSDVASRFSCFWHALTMLQLCRPT
jgi:hypothetical protein